MHAKRKLCLTISLAAMAAGLAGRADAQALRDSLMPPLGLETLQPDPLSAVAREPGAMSETDVMLDPLTVTPDVEEELRGPQPETAEEERVDEVDQATLPPPEDPLEDDPYAPLGVRVGSFILLPQLDLRSGYSTNIDAVPADPKSGTYYSVSPQLEFRSDWSRHELYGRFASETEFDKDDSTTALDGELALRLDLVRELVADLRATYTRAPEDLGDPDLPAGAVERPNAETYGASLALAKPFGDFSLGSSVSYDAYRYEDALLSDGSIYDNSDRDYDETELRLRAGYGPGTLGVFAEAGVNRRDYLRSIDDNGIRRGSQGYDLLAGVTIARGEVLEGELGIGYQRQSPEDPALEDVEGLFYRGSLAWRPTALTTVRLEGELRPEETVLEPGAAGVRVATAGLAVEHALRRNVVVTARIAAERSDYVGVPRLETTYSGGVDLDYRVNRWLSWRAGVSHARHDNEGTAGDYTDTRVEAGVTIRR